MDRINRLGTATYLQGLIREASDAACQRLTKLADAKSSRQAYEAVEAAENAVLAVASKLRATKTDVAYEALREVDRSVEQNPALKCPKCGRETWKDTPCVCQQSIRVRRSRK